MKTDHLFPPPPQYNQPPLRCDDITPERQRALNRLGEFAAVAESMVGPLDCERQAEDHSLPFLATARGFALLDCERQAEDHSLPFLATARGFALHCVKGSPFADEVAELLSRAKIHLDAHDHVDAPHVMLINPRKHWGVLGPIRGDVVLFPGDHAAIVTKPLCMGCQHFEAVSLVSSDGPPQIALLTHWLSTVRWIIRVIDEREVAPESGQPGQDGQEAAPSSDEPPASSNQDQASSNEAKPRKRKLTGLA